MSTRTMLSMMVAGVAVAGCATEGEEPIVPREPTADDVVMGNLECAEAGARVGLDLGDFELRIDPGAPGTFRVDDLNEVTLASADPLRLDWSATLGVDAVLIHGGGQTVIYSYLPEARAGTGLTAAWNPKLGEPYPIMGVDLCYDHELTVEAWAGTAFTRTVGWTIDLAPSVASVGVHRGDTVIVPFKARVKRDGAKDSEWTARGEVVVENPAPFPARLRGVEARLDELPAIVRCAGGWPFVLPPGGAMTCEYEVALPDPAPRTLHVVVKTGSYEVGMGVATAPVDFATADVTVRDGRVEVWDYRAGRLGSTDRDRSFTVREVVGPYDACGTVEYRDATMLIGADSGLLVGQDEAALRVEVHCCE